MRRRNSLRSIFCFASNAAGVVYSVARLLMLPTNGTARRNSTAQSTRFCCCRCCGGSPTPPSTDDAMLSWLLMIPLFEFLRWLPFHSSPLRHRSVAHFSSRAALPQPPQMHLLHRECIILEIYARFSRCFISPLSLHRIISLISQ